MSAVLSDRYGMMSHQLRLMEAKSADHAEAHVLTDAERRGLEVLSLQSLPASRLADV